MCICKPQSTCSKHECKENICPIQLQHESERRQNTLEGSVSHFLRAKGTLISEPRSSTPLLEKWASCPVSRGKNRMSQGVKDRGSLISVPLVLSVDLRGKGSKFRGVWWGVRIWWLVFEYNQHMEESSQGRPLSLTCPPRHGHEEAHITHAVSPDYISPLYV